MTAKKILNGIIVAVLLAAILNAVLILRAPDEHKYDAAISNVVRLHPMDSIDSQVIRAIIWRESNFNPNTLGHAQERGLMQVTPTVGREWATKTKVENFQDDDLYDPYTNIQVGTWYLLHAMHRYPNTDDPLAFALAEYNAGRTNVLRWIDPDKPDSRDAFVARIDFPLTKKYVESIEARYTHYKEDEQRPPWLRLLYRLVRQ